MSQYSEGKKAFTAEAAITANQRVKLGTGILVTPAGAAENGIGMAANDAVIGEAVTVLLNSTARTFKLIALDAIAAGGVFETAAAGKIQAKAAGADAGIALEESTADGDIIEGLFL